MTDVTIRRLEMRDARLGADAINALKPREECDGHDVAEKTMRDFLGEPRNVLIVASVDAGPVGYSVAYLLDRADRAAPMALLYEIEVTPDRRDRGIGRAMVEHLKEVAKAGGAVKMWVLTDRANAVATRLYASCGAASTNGGLLFSWSAQDLSPSVG